MHSPLHTYGDIHMNTHQQNGVCSNYGDIFESPQKSPLKSVFLGCKPYNWGHLRGPHKLVKNIHTHPFPDTTKVSYSISFNLLHNLSKLSLKNIPLFSDFNATRFLNNKLT